MTVVVKGDVGRRWKVWQGPLVGRPSSVSQGEGNGWPVRWTKSINLRPASYLSPHPMHLGSFTPVSKLHLRYKGKNNEYLTSGVVDGIGYRSTSWTVRDFPSVILCKCIETTTSRDCIGWGGVYALSSSRAMSGNVGGKKKNRGKSSLEVTVPVTDR